MAYGFVMELTEQQLRFFDAFGFLKFPGLFAEEMGEIANAFEQVWAEQGGNSGSCPTLPYLSPNSRPVPRH